MSTFKNISSVITFSKGSYQGKKEGQIINFNEVNLYTALISVSQAKMIVKTDIQGRDGKVKEFIGLDDYNISIDGTITGANGVTPINEILDLKAMLDAPIPISIVCPFLNQLGIHEVIIEAYTLPQESGGISYQTYNISASSHTPTILRISNV